MGEDRSVTAGGRQSDPLRRALLGGVSLIAFGIVLGRAPASYAQQVISASTASTVNSNGTGIFVNPNVDLTGSPGISNNTVTGTIYSQGTIESGSFGLENFSTIGTLTNATGGTIAGPSNGIFNTSGSIGTLSNSGLISGSGANARGVQNQGGTITLLTNSGTIKGSSGIAAQTGIGTIINQNGGTISSTGADYGIYVNAAVDLLENQAGGTISTGAGTAVLVQSHSIATLTNNGLITGANGVGNLNGTIGTLQNAGTIVGTSEGVYNDAELGTLTNTGKISGVFYGVSNGGSIGTLTNNGTINGHIAGFLNDTSITALLNETTGTLTGSISGSIGVLNTAGGTIGAFVNGLPGGSITADTVFGSNTGVSNHAVIETLSNNGTINGGVIGVANSYYAPVENVVIRAGLPEGDTQASIATLTNTGSITGGSAGIYNDSGYIGRLINSGSITGGSFGVLNAGTIGAVANTGGYISYLSNTSSIGTGATAIGNGGLIATLANTGTISGASFGINNTIAGTIGTLTNSGAIIATATSTNAGGFRLAGLSNQGSITTVNNEQGATIAGEYYGFENQYDGTLGTLINSGLISGAASDAFGLTADNIIGVIDNTATGTITGGEGGIAADGDFGTIINAGTISGHFGIYESGPSTIGTLANSGLISATYYPGVDVESGTINVFTNTGTIISTSSEGVSNTGVIGTLTNSGIITGHDGLVSDLTLGTLANETAGTLAGTISGTIGILSATDLNTPGTITLLMNGLPGASITADTVFGSITGIANESIIETLANNGTIYGGTYGIANSYHTQYVDSVIRAALPQGDTQATIATLANTGSITGVDTGIYNDAGYIGTLTNSGTIAGNYAIFQETGAGGGATIATLANSGIIFGNTLAIFNGGATTIGTLTNSGTISGGSTAIANGFDATIGLLSNSGSISGGRNGIYNRTFIGTLGNSGVIAGNSQAIFNDFGTINELTNSGLIESGAGPDNGLCNYGGTIFTISQSGGGTITGGTIGVLNIDGATIGQLTNGGQEQTNLVLTNDLIDSPVNGNNGEIAFFQDTIFGSITGLSNDGALISTLTNNGTIAGGTLGIANSVYTRPVEAVARPILSDLTNDQVQGSIVTLTNNGSIYGGQIGVYNDGGYIGTLSNTGTIAGGRTAIDNYNATVATLTNSGSIFGTITGINNSDPSSTIGTIINQSTGNIYGGAVALNAGDGTGINNAGLITSGNILLQPALELGDSDIVTNSGTISGGGLLYVGADSTVTNSGTIAALGGDAVTFFDDATNYLTLTTGTDIVGTIYGNGSPGQITLDGTGNLTSPIANFGTGSALNLDTSANWTASGTWAIAAVTNDGSFGPGETANGGVGSRLFLTGNFTQNADGTLLVAVEPDDGTFTTSDFVITGNASLSGAVEFTFAPGTYAADTHSFLSATDVTGTFTSQHYINAPSGLTASVLYTDETDPLLQLSGTGAGIVNTGTTTASTITTPPIITPPVTPPIFVVRPPDTGIFADELQSSANLAQASNAALLGKAAEGAAAASAVCGAEAGATPAQTTPDKITGVEKLTNAVADAFCGAGGWIQASGTALNAEGEGATPGYNADTAGFLAGIDAPVNNAGTRLGLSLGYDETFLADAAGGKGQVDTFRAGIFGSQAVGNFMLAGDFLYGHTSTNSQRVTGVGYAKSGTDGNIYSGALQADTLVHLGALNLVPQAGLRIAGLSAGSFAESGVLPAFALTGNSGFYTSVQPFINLDVSTVFLTQSNVSITPDASFGYAYEAGDIGHALIVTSRDGTHFATDYLKLDPNIASLSAGISAGAGMWSVYARYSAELTGNWTSQTGEAGLRLRF
jgi:hypothetical protein